jgi:hypothetical protein
MAWHRGTPAWYVTKWCSTGGKHAKNRHIRGRTVDNEARI